MAAPATAPAVQQEILALLDRLAASGCDFERNGRWHTAVEARAHLQRKLEVGLARQAIESTEQFIEHGASASSFTGRPYRVRCAGATPVEAGPWLRGELVHVRARPAAAPAASRP